MIDISYNVIGIRWNELSYSKIRLFFETPQVENDRLEFKSYFNKTLDEWCKDLAKEICAFLNSDGGILIWGAPSETKVKGIKICQGQLTSVPLFSTDDVIRKIAGKINELPNSIQVKILSDLDKNVYVFQMHISEYRPHQTDDRYYMRLNSESRPAPHHYVEALMKRIRYPDMRGQIIFSGVSYKRPIPSMLDNLDIRIAIKVILINNSPLQNEENFVFRILCNNGNPMDFGDSWPPEKYPILTSTAGMTVQAIQGAALKILHYGQKKEFNYAIGYHNANLQSPTFRTKVMLQFGGRYSPLKYSLYEFDLDFVSYLTMGEGEMYPFIGVNLEASENVLFADADIIIISEFDQWNSIDYQ